MITLILLLVVGALFAFFKYIPQYVRKQRRLIKAMKQFNGPPLKPIIGYAWECVGDHKVFIKTTLDLAKKYKSPVGVWILNVAAVIIGKPEDIQIVMSKNLEKDPIYQHLADLLGDGLITCTNAKWKRRRRIVGSVFSTANLMNNFLLVFNKYSLKLVKNLEKECNISHEKDMWSYFFSATFESICENTMGLGICEEDMSNYDFVFTRASMMVGHRMYRPWLYPPLLFYISKYFTGNLRTIEKAQAVPRKILQKKKNYSIQTECKSQNVKSKDLIDLIREARDNNNSYFSDEETVDEILTIIFAGSDTTSTTSAFTLLMLAMKPEIQDKAYAEISEIFGDSSRMPTPDDLPKMLYLEQCIKETLRYSSMVPIIVRCSDQDIPITDGYVIPAGAKIGIAPFLVHHDESIYPNPYTWNPDNFLPEKIKHLHPCAFIPFGAGLRTCIGSKYAMISLKVMVSTILRNFIVSTTMKKEDEVWDFHFTLKLSQFPMKFRYRHEKSIF